MPRTSPRRWALCASIVAVAPVARVSQRSPRLRADIQGLRAVAVAAVVAFHLSPAGLPGGYVGVDVFFVISGFLITSHLLDHPPSRAGEVLAFWARRVRRLLPASLLVLAATLCASRLVGPSTQWDNTARMARAAALYVVNWLLAGDAVDYLASDNAPTAVQHYWSLSVEEQFYFVWPILVVLLVLVAKLTSRPLGRVLLIGFTLVCAGSLAWSVVMTSRDPAAAYFTTPTRIWELALGGVLAGWYARHTTATAHPDADPTSPAPSSAGLPGWVAAVLTWGGLAAIAVSCLRFNGHTPFPGYLALLPTLGTVAVIAGHSTDRAGVAGRLFSLRPVQWLGGVSYSVYLWHWPLLILLPYASGGSRGWLDNVVIVAGTAVLSQLTKVFVEDPGRRWKPQARLRTVFVVAAAAMAVVLVGAALQSAEVAHQGQFERTRRADRVRAWGPCLGAGSLRRSGCPETTFDSLVVGPDDAENFDKPQTYADVPGGRDCEAQRPKLLPVECTFGERNSSTDVWIVGNSHAGMWLPPLQSIARRQHWRLETHIASGCVIAPVEQIGLYPQFTDSCRRWTVQTMREIRRARPDLVVMANRIAMPVVGEKSISSSEAAYTRAARVTLRSFQRSKIPLVIIRDTPALPRNAPDCVDQYRDDLSRCVSKLKDIRSFDPFAIAADQIHARSIHVVDLTKRLCHRGTCAFAIGGVIVYFDQTHLTATYSRTLAPELEGPLVESLADRASPARTG